MTMCGLDASRCSSSCDATNCCPATVPSATNRVSVGLEGSEHDRTNTGTVPARASFEGARTTSCAQCGDDPGAVVRAFKAGMQAAAWDTYRPNLDAAALHAELDMFWHGPTVKRYGE